MGPLHLWPNLGLQEPYSSLWEGQLRCTVITH